MPHQLTLTGTAFPSRLLLFAADGRIRPLLEAALAGQSVSICHVSTREEFQTSLSQREFEATVVEQSLAAGSSAAPAIWLTPADSAAIASGDLQQGIQVRLGTPEATGDLKRALRQTIQLSHLLLENSRLQRRLTQRRSGELVGHGPLMERLRGEVSAAAGGHQAVSLHGEQGTGKQLAARLIHDAGERAYRPFIKVNCGSLTSANLDHELFGIAPGADAASPAGRTGRLELAHCGVLVLVDVDQIAFPLQIKLLDTLQKGNFERLGGNERISLDVRLISTSRVGPEKSAGGPLHPELRNYLCQSTITVPPLREHRDDIALLAELFLNQVAQREGEPPRRIPLDTLQLLRGHDWPGNVRELENLIDRACALDIGSKLSIESVRPWLADQSSAVVNGPSGLSLAGMERKLIESTFARCGGNRERTAQALQIGLRTLSGKLRDYGYPPRGGPGSNRQERENHAA